MRKNFFLFVMLLAALCGKAQLTEQVKAANIHTAMLFPYGNQAALPIMRLGGGEQLELHFDDLDGGYKNYYYTYLLCNADWTPALLSYFDYVKGYTNNRINTFRNSSIARRQYTHYQAYLPERNCTPTRSGNYLLKVYLDGDTAKTVFTKRIMVVEEKVTAAVQVLQPFTSQTNRTHQRLILRVNANSLNVTNPQQQVKVVVMQNNRWDNSILNALPTFVRGKDLEYNTDNDLVFEGGREWRWLDLRSFRFWSDRVEKGEIKDGQNHIYVKPDATRSGFRYSYYADRNGMFSIESTDNVNPYWQGEFATVHFRYVPEGSQPFADKDLYISGKLTNYELNANTRMTFNAEKGWYEASLLLKQGFYNYQYVTVNRNGGEKRPLMAYTEGNTWETENVYQVLIYYRSFGARTDELVGFVNASSYNGRLTPGF